MALVAITQLAELGAPPEGPVRGAALLSGSQVAELVRAMAHPVPPVPLLERAVPAVPLRALPP